MHTKIQWENNVRNISTKLPGNVFFLCGNLKQSEPVTLSLKLPFPASNRASVTQQSS